MAVIKEQKQPRYTSIDKIFHIELFIVRLCGGFMFNGNIYLCILYRAVVIFWAKYGLAGLHLSFQKSLYKSLTRAVSQNMNFFYLFYTAATIFATIATIVSSLKFHRPLLIILNKRLDCRYLENTIIHVESQTSLTACTTGSTISSSGIDTLSVGSIGSSRSGGSSLVMKPTISSCRTIQMVRKMSKVSMLKWILVSYLSMIVLTDFLQSEYSKQYLLMMNATETTGGTTGSQMSRVMKTLLHAKKVNRTASVIPATTDRQSEAYKMLEPGTSWAQMLTSNTIYLARVFVQYMINVVTFYQIYGQVLVTLMITATLTDILRRINEQNHLLMAMDELGENNIIHQVCQTTDILIQTRDVLIVLRKAVGIDYLAIQTYEVSQLIVLFGSIMTFIPVHNTGWLVIFSINYIQVVFSIILTRITYHWLHTEARKIRLNNEQLLVNCGQSMPRLSPGAERSDGLKRIEATTNYRLAKEIEQLWPTDWFEPNLKSCLSLNLFVATFVATLQQLVEASIKVTNNQSGG